VCSRRTISESEEQVTRAWWRRVVCCYGSIGFALPFSAFALLCCAFIRTTIQLSVRPPRQAATLSTKKTESSAAPAPIHVSPTYLLATCTVAAPPLAGVKACLCTKHERGRELAIQVPIDGAARTTTISSVCRRRGHRTRAQAPPPPPVRAVHG
jgi:hypothetical protein